MFKHECVQSLYDKAMTKYTKMIETEKGQKFFAHLVKAFILSGTEALVDHFDSPSGLFKCDITNSKCISTEARDAFQNIVNQRLSMFERSEDESDEDYEIRKKAYFECLTTSNPYAVSNSVGYKAEKTDKLLCMEAMYALCDKYNQVTGEDSVMYPDLIDMISSKPKPKGQKKLGKKKKVTPKVKDKPAVYKTKPTKGASSNTIGDVFNGEELKLNLTQE